MPTKRCTTCNLDKPLTSFGKNSSQVSGLSWYCKECNASRSKKWAEEHPKDAEAKKSAIMRAMRWRKDYPTKAGIATLNSNRLIRSRFNTARWRATNKRELSWTLSFEEYEVLSKLSCSYCRGSLPEFGVGLDRVDSSLGYTSSNVVPCCDWCNVAKSDHFTYEEMIKYIGPAIRLARENRSNDS